MKHPAPTLARLEEVLQACLPYRALVCAPNLDARSDGALTITLTFPTTHDDTHVGLDVLGLADALRFVVDVAQMRGFAQRYDIDPADLERALPTLLRAHANHPPAPLTVNELTAVLAKCDEQSAWDPTHLATAIPKLRALLVGEIF